MKKSFDILVPGEINPDLVLTGDVVPAFGQVEKLVEICRAHDRLFIGNFRLRGCPAGAQGGIRGRVRG